MSINKYLQQYKKGIFIVFEGLDKTGKTTQSTQLSKYLINQGLQSQRIQFPDRTTLTGNIISQYLQSHLEINDHSIHLLFSANRWEKVDYINENINKGTNIICDRYAYSGLAYSVAKGLDFDWCKSVDRGLPKPDIIFYLQAPNQVLEKRGNYGQERYENQEFQKQVELQFKRLCFEEQMIVIETIKDQQEVEQEIQQHVKNRILMKGNQQELWK